MVLSAVVLSKLCQNCVKIAAMVWKRRVYMCVVVAAAISKIGTFDRTVTVCVRCRCRRVWRNSVRHGTKILTKIRVYMCVVVAAATTATAAAGNRWCCRCCCVDRNW